MIRTPRATYTARNRRTGRSAISVSTRICREGFKVQGVPSPRVWPAREVTDRLGEVLVTSLTSGDVPRYREQGLVKLREVLGQLEDCWCPPSPSQGKMTLERRIQ